MNDFQKKLKELVIEHYPAAKDYKHLDISLIEIEDAIKKFSEPLSEPLLSTREKFLK